MVLTVPFEGFPAAMARQGIPGPVNLWTIAGRTYLSAGDSARSLIVQAVTPKPRRAVEERLGDLSLEWVDGRWTTDQDVELMPSSSFWVAGVAYRSHDGKPGLWMDAWLREPSVGEVLNRMYEDFQQTGDLGEASLDDFLRVAEPSVVVLEPEQQLRYAQEEFGC